MAETSKTVEARPEIKKPSAAPPFTIVETEEDIEYLKLVVYGEPGVGKTFLVATAAAVAPMRDVFMVDMEGGSLTLQGADPVHKFGSIDRVRVNSCAALGKVHKYLKLHCQFRDLGTKESEKKLVDLESGLKGKKITKPRHYRTVILDSLTEADALCMYQLLGIVDSTRLDEEVATAEWAEYKRNFHMVQRAVRNFRNLPCHLLITCGRIYGQDEQKRYNYMPALTGKLVNAIQGFADVVGYYTLKRSTEETEISRILTVQPTGRFCAKNRFSSFTGTQFEDPTIGSILTAIGLPTK